MASQETCSDLIDLEQRYFEKTVASFKLYKKHMLHRLKIGSDYYSRLPESQKKLVNEYPDTVEKIKSCIIHNSELISKVLRNISSNIFDDHPFSFDQGKAINGTDKEASIINNPYGVTSGDMDKVRSTLKQFVRDWSSEGQAERDSCYKPVLNELVDIYKEKDRSTLHILVPGAGLGRLAWEIAHLGFNCQGNEFSLHMLLPAYFILNSCRNIDSYTLYPWVSQSCNILSRKDQLASVRFPDVSPSDLPKNIQFSMAAGDFLEVYSEKDSWDAIVTVFFIDTAHNALDYLSAIWTILRPGGYWINLGPLLYHFSSIPYEESIEFSYDELKLAIDRMGFMTIELGQHMDFNSTRCGFWTDFGNKSKIPGAGVYDMYPEKSLPNSLSLEETSISQINFNDKIAIQESGIQPLASKSAHPTRELHSKPSAAAHFTAHLEQQQHLQMQQQTPAAAFPLQVPAARTRPVWPPQNVHAHEGIQAHLHTPVQHHLQNTHRPHQNLTRHHHYHQQNQMRLQQTLPPDHSQQGTSQYRHHSIASSLQGAGLMHTMSEVETMNRISVESQQDPWAISPDQKAFYLSQFLRLQSDPSARLSGQQAKTFFELSKLPVHELSKIWELSDVDRDGQLTLSEFNVAMHLVVLRRVNLPIPDRLPGSLARLATSTCHLSSTGPLPRPPMCSQSVDTIGANSSSATEPQRSEEEMLTNPLSPALSVGQTATGPLFPPSSLLPPPLPPAPPSLAQSEVSAFSTPVSDFLVVGSVGTDPIRSSFLPSWNPKVGCLEATVPTAFSRIANDTVVSLSEDRVSLGPGVVDDRPWSVSSSLQSDVVSLAEGMPRFDSRLAHDDFIQHPVPVRAVHNLESSDSSTFGLTLSGHPSEATSTFKISNVAEHDVLWPTNFNSTCPEFFTEAPASTAIMPLPNTTSPTSHAKSLLPGATLPPPSLDQPPNLSPVIQSLQAPPTPPPRVHWPNIIHSSVNQSSDVAPVYPVLLQSSISDQSSCLETLRLECENIAQLNDQLSNQLMRLQQKRIILELLSERLAPLEAI